jgi:hypothetical protein
MRVVIIRLATVQDADVLAAVQVRTWQVAYRGQIPQEYLDQRDPVRRQQGWLEWFGGNPAPAAVFVVLATNERARRFYEAAGWQADGSTKTDASRGFPLVEVRYRHVNA